MADRHANFTADTIDRETLTAVVRAVGAPVICETPSTVFPTRSPG